MIRVYTLGCVLVLSLGMWACTIDCSKLPDNRPKQVLVLPVRVEEPCDCGQKYKEQEEYIETVKYRMRYCEESGY